MYSIWRYFNPIPTPIIKDTPLIKFGRWENQLDYLDYHYHNVATKLILFANEAGTDRYGRYFDAEPLLDFVLDAGITDKSADYMYRYYVYHLLSQHEHIDVDKEELRYLFDEFTLIPEHKKVYMDQNEKTDNINASTNTTNNGGD